MGPWLSENEMKNSPAKRVRPRIGDFFSFSCLPPLLGLAGDPFMFMRVLDTFHRGEIICSIGRGHIEKMSTGREVPKTVDSVMEILWIVRVLFVC